MQDQTTELLSEAQAIGVLVIPDRKRRRYEVAKARWRERCYQRGWRYVEVQPIGPLRSHLRVEVPDGAPRLSDSWAGHIRELFIASQQRKSAAIVGPNTVSVRLPHDTATALAAELANAEVAR